MIPGICIVVLCASLLHGSTCDGLRKLTLPNATITAAEEVARGALQSPRADVAAVFKDLPPFCRVSAILTPTPDSDVRIEVWMPLKAWNRRFISNGNGGFAGSIVTTALARAVAQGFAAASTDTGHQSPDTIDARWALGHPEKLVDFGWRAIHEMTVKAKVIVQVFYGAAAEYSYFSGCSNAGRQGMMEAQRFPADYDGIIAGTPADSTWTRLVTQLTWDAQVLEADPASYIPGAKIPALAAAVLKACDTADGVRDGIVNDPRACHFDPEVMLCKTSDANNDCLSRPQIAALKKIYAGPRTSEGDQVNPGFSPGAEAGANGWGLWLTGAAPHQALAEEFLPGVFRYMLGRGPNWDIGNFDIDRDFKLLEQELGPKLDATDTNMKAFRDRGGKLILYHGWGDAVIPPMSTIEYYERIRATMGPTATDSFVRLYMVPGMQHCGGGNAPDSFGQFDFRHGTVSAQSDPQHSMYAALEQWIQKGVAPGPIIATHAGDPRMTRPICPYPQVARYQGARDTNDATNFSCVPP